MPDTEAIYSSEKNKRLRTVTCFLKIMVAMRSGGNAWVDRFDLIDF